MILLVKVMSKGEPYDDRTFLVTPMTVLARMMF